jgi:hypothetical protein
MYEGARTNEREKERVYATKNFIAHVFIFGLTNRKYVFTLFLNNSLNLPNKMIPTYFTAVAADAVP